MASLFGTDIVVKEEYIAVHFYNHDGKSFRYVTSEKCEDFKTVFDFLFTKGFSGTFMEFIIYLEDNSRLKETKAFFEKAQRGLNWFVTQGNHINAGILREKYKKPSYLKVDY